LYLELYNPLGFLVAQNDNGADDGHNARIAYTVPSESGGTYEVRVRAASGHEATGDYVLRVTGTLTDAGPAPAVIAANPENGGSVANPPTALVLSFSEGLRSDSVQASDLLIGGGASVTGVEQIDGQTVRFLLSVPNVPGTYSYSLAQGVLSDLQGSGSDAFAGSFTIDQSGPRVIDQMPALQASTPFNELTFVFDEALDAASVSAADVAAFTGPGGTNLLASITGATVAGNSLTVRFKDQAARGTYTMRLGPAISDRVGNLMDQNANGTGGETVDYYVGTVDLQSPDLRPDSVAASGSAVFGQTIVVEWAVSNIGNDAAVEGWSDRIYLSTNTTLEEGSDTLLVTQPASAAPLAAGAGYQRSATVRLPLTTALSSGLYYLIVGTDALNTQPESNSSNNDNQYSG
jgi:methionine-rich copper-binding protein CopC